MTPNPLCVEFTIKETLDERWAVWFEGLELISLAGGTSLLRGEVPDRSALHGCLDRIRDLNLNLISVSVEEK